MLIGTVVQNFLPWKKVRNIIRVVPDIKNRLSLSFSLSNTKGKVVLGINSHVPCRSQPTLTLSKKKKKSIREEPILNGYRVSPRKLCCYRCGQSVIGFGPGDFLDPTLVPAAKVSFLAPPKDIQKTQKVRPYQRRKPERHKYTIQLSIG